MTTAGATTAPARPVFMEDEMSENTKTAEGWYESYIEAHKRAVRAESNLSDLAVHLNKTTETAADAVAERDALAAQLSVMREALDNCVVTWSGLGGPAEDWLHEARAALAIEPPAALETIRREEQKRLYKLIEMPLSRIEKLAFDIPPPNETTPQIVEMVLAIRQLALAPSDAVKREVEEG